MQVFLCLKLPEPTWPSALWVFLCLQFVEMNLMQINWISPDQIRPYENNPRKNTTTVEKLTKSLSTYGWQQPIVVDKDNIIIVGHARWQAAQKLKMAQVPVLCATNLTDAQVRSYRLADNRLSDESRWDTKGLSEELAALQELDIDLSLTGFRESELTQLLGSTDEISLDPDSINPADKKVISQLGDIWLLGSHRLMCGDATNPEQVQQLMDGQKADLIFTDPPYNVSYQGGPKARRKGGRRDVYNDDLPSDAYYQLLENALCQMAMHAEPEASLYLCHADQHLPALQAVLVAADYSVRNVLIWAKQHFVLNFGRYKTQHEPILYCHRTGQTDTWYGDNRQSTLWCFDRPVNSDLHPTMKPIALIEQALHNSSLPGDRVMDLFGGSGSTLMACHYNQRNAFVMEIQPRYVDVIIRRWQLQTQGTATLVADGCSIAEVEFKRQSASH